MFIEDYVCIVGSFINAFTPPLLSDSASHLKLSKKMLQQTKIKKYPYKNLFTTLLNEFH